MPVSAREFQATAIDAGTRLDRFLGLHLPELSRTQIQSLIREGSVELIGHGPAEKPGLRLHGVERVRVEVRPRPALLTAVPEAIPLAILYEDEDLVVVDKPAGLLVHAGGGVSRGTLVNALLHRFRELSALAGPLRPGIVHRLDKNTSGALVVAKNDLAHRQLAEQFRRRAVEKRYLALVHGRMARPQDRIRLRVARDLRHRTRMTTRRAVGREAVTDYRVLREFSNFTLLEAVLHTGRTHQLRVHVSALGHPVVGDTLYGAPRQLRIGRSARPTLDRNFLHAYRIGFEHPRSGRCLEVTSPLPAELQAFLDELEDLTRP